MKPEDIEACVERAETVTNGFRFPTEQSARDVLKLAKHIKAQQSEIRELKRKVLALELKGVGQSPFGRTFEDALRGRR